MSRFSYSKLNTYLSCGFKYDLIYNKGNYFFTDSLATELGVLLHHCEEMIAKALKNNEKPDYDKLIDDFKNINIPKKSLRDTSGGIYGINILKNKYKDEFYEVDANGVSYFSKCLNYITSGIYRLENYINEHPGYQIYDMEKYFSVEYKGYTLSGYIDRIIYDSNNDLYIIDDIKTKGKPFKDTELTTPLQFVVYTYAFSRIMGISEQKIICNYDLPFCNMRQSAGTAGFLKRGYKKLDEIFKGISINEYTPHPSPLCAWCVFSPTSESSTIETYKMCPYHSLWTRENKTFKVKNEWEGIINHDKILKKYVLELSQSQQPHV